MARRERPAEARERRDMQKTCAFWGLAIAAVLFVVAAVMGMIDKWVDVPQVFTTIMNIFNIVSKVAILLAVALPAYAYVRGRKRGWRIFYWVALIIYALCVVFDVVVIAA
ncbi:MAG: hypothetical protein LUD50_06585 [Clostridia bacterium]|nr:hypothetical protein [Clostridia bacterium]